MNYAPGDFMFNNYSCISRFEKGHCYVGIFSKVAPLDVHFKLMTESSDAHRLITAEFEKFFLVSTYTVNSGRGWKSLKDHPEWSKVLDAHILKLDKKKPVITSEDINVSHISDSFVHKINFKIDWSLLTLSKPA